MNDTINSGHKIAVFGYWRTGTNLLLSYMRRGTQIFNFNEYFGVTLGNIESAFTDREEEFEQIKIKVNDHFRLMCNDYYKGNIVVKIMMPHLRFVEPQTLDLFNFKYLLYRTDFSRTIVSKVVAESRQSWANVGGAQPEFNSTIDIGEYTKNLKSLITLYYDYIKNPIEVDCIVNYENDLEPYAQQYPTDMQRSTNFTITNQHEIDLVYKKHKMQVEEICAELQSRSSKLLSLHSGLQMLKN